MNYPNPDIFSLVFYGIFTVSVLVNLVIVMTILLSSNFSIEKKIIVLISNVVSIITCIVLGGLCAHEANYFINHYFIVNTPYFYGPLIVATVHKHFFSFRKLTQIEQFVIFYFQVFVLLSAGYTAVDSAFWYFNRI